MKAHWVLLAPAPFIMLWKPDRHSRFSGSITSKSFILIGSGRHCSTHIGLVQFQSTALETSSHRDLFFCIVINYNYKLGN